MKKIYITGIMVLLIVAIAISFAQNNSAASQSSVYDFTMENIDGEMINLNKYQGKVALVVNVASKCGFTPQYEGLQSLYEEYKDRGFVVLGFPANNFANQEPGTDAQIQEFCTTNFGVSFPMFSKISVKGDDQDPLYNFLTSETTNPEFSGEITWNFNKFLVGPDGKVINRFESSDEPQSEKVVTAIEQVLNSV